MRSRNRLLSVRKSPRTALSRVGLGALGVAVLFVSGASLPRIDPALVAGNDGQALDARQAAAGLLESETFGRPPLTLDGWVKIDGKQGFNIIVASEPKASATHWELYTYARTGHLSFYLPGIATSDIRSSRDICDGRWHYLGLQYAADRVRLFVDGERVADQAIDEPAEPLDVTALAIGRLVEGGIGCDGAIDTLRLRRGIHDVSRPWQKPPAPDSATLALWTFDELTKDSTFVDRSSEGQHLVLIQAVKNAPKQRSPIANQEELPADREKITGHWGEDAIGFRWTEEDSVDGRWQLMDKGPFLATTLALGDRHVLKSLLIEMGEGESGAVCYDTASMTCEAAWQGDFVQTHPARYGLIRHPTPGGTLTWNRQGPTTWGDANVRYEGLTHWGRQCLVSYQVNGTRIHETPRVLQAEDRVGLLRTLSLSPHREALKCYLGLHAEALLIQRRIAEWNVVSWDGPGQPGALAWRWSDRREPPSLDAEDRAIDLPGDSKTRQLQIAFIPGSEPVLEDVLKQIEPIDFDVWQQPGPRLWKQTLATRAQLGEPAAGLRMDTIDVPFDNPYRALMFLSGIDFFANGDAAISTVHGDVWLVRGLQGELREVTWQRFATGLYQPLGVRIVEGQLFVLGKDQITRLEDRNGDGEADRYVNFNNAGDTSVGTHDYATCLETDRDGNFYYVRGNTGVERVSREGTRHEVIATGLRNPNGMGLGPGDLITVAPQEGEWTPASNIAVIREGGHYGYRGPQVSPDRPLGYDPPMLWLPRLLDNSSGGQVWLPQQGWGPLNGGLIHLSFGRCWPLLIMPQQIGGVWQAGAVKLPFECQSGICRGRIQPDTGHLFLTGLKGWASASIDDGCLVRLAPVADRFPLPVRQRVVNNGIVLTFGESLDKDSVQDASNWSGQQWNYRYAADYGSADYKISSAGQQGHDEVAIDSATLLDDGRSVFLEISDIAPVMQMAINYRINNDAGDVLRDTVYLTIHHLDSESLEPGPHSAEAISKRGDQPEREQLGQGVILRLSQQSIAGPIIQDTRVNRFIALDIDGDPLTPSIEARSLQAVFEGWLYIDQNDIVELKAMAEGVVELEVGGQTVLAQRESATETRWSSVPLAKGLNAIRLIWDTVDEPSSGIRFLWSGENFAWEPVPSSRLFHKPDDPRLTRSQQSRLARQEFAQLNCHRCHALPAAVSSATRRMPELDFEPPSLVNAGRRYQDDWLFQWILSPRTLDESTEMPHLFEATNPKDRDTVADLVAYLKTLRRDELPAAPSQDDPESTAQAGAYRFEEIGCVACHTVEPETVDRESGLGPRVSLLGVSQKYTRRALADFLTDPTRYYASHRMPVFQLDATARSELVSFLMSLENAGQIPECPTGDPLLGAKAFVEKGCANCHRVEPGQTLEPARRPLKTNHQDDGCLGPTAEAGAGQRAPDFGMDKARRGRLAELLDANLDSLASDSSVEIAERWVQRLRCTACHQRDGNGGDLAEIVFGESIQGLSPERLPDLTWTGEKLRQEWLGSFLGDRSRESSRPWLRSRMPAFPAYAADLGHGLVRQHGLSVAEEWFTEGPNGVTEDARQAGAMLMGQAQGFDCRQCHALGELPATGDQRTQVALGVNFEVAAERLNYGYYRRWMLDPLRIDPLTKMPRYSEDRRTTKIDGLLDGEAVPQFDAIWAYLRQLDRRSANR